LTAIAPRLRVTDMNDSLKSYAWFTLRDVLEGRMGDSPPQKRRRQYR
jgi:hypothetical protein